MLHPVGRPSYFSRMMLNHRLRLIQQHGFILEESGAELANKMNMTKKTQERERDNIPRNPAARLSSQMLMVVMLHSGKHGRCPPCAVFLCLMEHSDFLSTLDPTVTLRKSENGLSTAASPHISVSWFHSHLCNAAPSFVKEGSRRWHDSERVQTPLTSLIFPISEKVVNHVTVTSINGSPFHNSEHSSTAIKPLSI